MKYVRLGKSGMKVSKLSYGNWTNASDEEEAQKIANSLIKTAWEHGINFFDTAEAYNNGSGEKQLGIALRSLGVPRADYLVSTKIFWGDFEEDTINVNNRGISRKRLMEGLNRSLKNLEMDYVDVVFCHRYDEETTTLEVVEAMKAILDSGKAIYWGTSAWPPVRVMEAMLLCDIYHCPRPIAEQCQYNMFQREPIEKKYVALFDDYQLGTTTWSPLASGILTGKYNNGIPEDSRFANHGKYIFIFNKYMGGDAKDTTLKKLEELAVVAKKIGCTMAQLAIAWILISKDVDTCIFGASKISQLEENLKALEFVDKITPEISEEIEGILKNRPTQGTDYRNRSVLAKRR